MFSGFLQSNDSVNTKTDSNSNTCTKKYLNDRISKIYCQLSSKLVLSNGSYGKLKGDFDAPKAIAIDSNNTDRIFIADALNCRVQVFSPSPLAEYQFEMSIRSIGQQNAYFWGVHLRGEVLFVTEPKASAMSIFTLDGEIISRYKPELSLLGDPILSSPRGLIINEYNNDLLVCDSGLGSIRILSSDFPLYKLFGEDVLRNPYDIKMYRSNIIVLDSNNIFEFSSNGLCLRQISKLVKSTYLMRCEFITIDCIGNILVNDSNGVVLVISYTNNNNNKNDNNSNNNNITDDDDSANDDGDKKYKLSKIFVNPKGLAFDKNQRLVIVNEGSPRLNIFELNFDMQD